MNSADILDTPKDTHNHTPRTLTQTDAQRRNRIKHQQIYIEHISHCKDNTA